VEDFDVRVATTRAGASIRAFALSVGLVAMLGGAATGASAELKDPLSPLTLPEAPFSVSDATIRRTIWRGIRNK
jgi:hypothetical protein